MGFKKIRTPDRVWKLLSEFWENNKVHCFFDDFTISPTFRFSESDIIGNT
jgi:hypothetical protein